MTDPAAFSFLKLHRAKFIIGLLIALYLFNGISTIRHQSITSDEGSFLSYAIRFLKGNPERIRPVRDNSKMPVVVLNALPRAAEQILHPGTKKNDEGQSDIVAGRYLTLLVPICVIILVFTWSRKLYGEGAGLFSAFLFTFCPNNLSVNTLVTTDSYSILFLLLTFYLLWRFAVRGGWGFFLFFSLSLAFSQLVKQSLIHLYILTPLCLGLYFKTEKWKWNLPLFIKRLFVFILVSCFIINLGYYFHKTNTSLGEYHFMSHLFREIKANAPANLVIPLPKPFLDGLDMAKYYDQIGGGDPQISSFGKTTILGRSSTGGGFWYYYLVSILFKTPLSYFMLISWGFYLLLKKSSYKQFMQREFFLFAPVIYYFVYLSFFYNTQCGIRHIIFIYPFLFVFSGIVIKYITSPYQKFLVAILSFFLIISFYRYRGNYYAYTNELIGEKKMAYRYVGASNLSCRQGDLYLKDYLAKNPGVSMVPRTAQTGTFLIAVEDYLDIWNLHRFDWISGIPPSNHVAYSYLLIKVEEKDIRP